MKIFRTLSLSLLLACTTEKGDDDTGTGTGTGTGTDTTSTSTPTGDDTNTSTGAIDVADQLAQGCGFERPCGTVTIDCGDEGDPKPCPQPYAAELTCALEKLAAGEAFALHINAANYVKENADYDVVFDGKGGAVRQYVPGVALGFPAKCSLLSKEMFAACLTVANDDPMHTTCAIAFNWFLDCSDGADVTCPALP